MLKVLIKGIAPIIALFIVFWLLVNAVEEAENKYKGDLAMGSNQKTAKSESFSVALTKQEKVMAQNVKRHYGFGTDRELLVALLKRANLSIK